MADNERANSLARRIADDPALRDRLNAASGADRSAILTELGYGGLTAADIAQVYVPQSVEELDDSQLAGIAGGFGSPVALGSASNAFTVLRPDHNQLFGN